MFHCLHGAGGEMFKVGVHEIMEQAFCQFHV